jgi:predicted ATPase
VDAEVVVRRRYRIGELLGEGGMGAVFRALDLGTQEVVAIKSLKSTSLADDKADIERFLREGEALRLLNHPNIVKLLDTFQDGGQHYLVMELVEGGSLETRLRGGARVPVERVLALGLDISDALSRAHRLGIVHRDIKPANVLLAPDGTPRLSDFGVAHIAGKAQLSASNAVIGTLDYLSPEALLGEPVDAGADIWAFGVLLFELIAGRRPFAAEHPGATLQAILHDGPADLEELSPECPTELVDLVYRMLEKDRRQRIPSARQVGAELESILGRVGTEPGQSAANAHVGATAFARTVARPSLPELELELPAQTTPFIGREVELADLARLLLDPAVRLVSVVGPGGMGKSRLVVETARRYFQGNAAFSVTLHGPPAVAREVFLVELAPLARADLVLAALAEAVGFRFYPGGEPKAQLLDYLRARSALLVLDNFEHVLDAASLVHEILQAAPNVKVLTTSRERLSLSGEHVFALSGLALPDVDDNASWLEFSSVQLFAESARRVKRDFELTDEAARAAAQICRLVQGLPLGIVLAASWSNLLTPSEIAEEISKSLDFLAGELRDMPARQHSLRAVFDYSYERLAADERAVFTRLAVFCGGFSRAAAEQVAGASLRILAALVNQSLITRDPTSGRYRLHELLRKYAESRLGDDPGEAERTADAHAVHYASFLAERAARFKGREPELVAGELDTEIDNVRAAWARLRDTRNPSLLGPALETLGLFFAFRSAFVEAEATFAAAASSFALPEPERSGERARLLARALTLQARACADQWRQAEAITLATRALEWLDETTQPAEVGDALLVLALSSFWVGDTPRGLEASEHSVRLHRRVGAVWDTAQALARLCGQCGDWIGSAKAEACARESIELQRSLPGGVVVIANSFTDLGTILAERGNYDEGCSLMLEGLALMETQGKSYGKLECLQHLSRASRMRGDYDAAEAYARQSLVLAREMFPFAEGWSHALLGDVLKERGQLDAAAVHYRAAMADKNPTTTALATLNLGDIAGQRGEYVLAGAMLRQSLVEFERHGASWGIIIACDYLGHLACDEGRYADSDELFQRALEHSLESGLLRLGLNVVASIARSKAGSGETERAVELLTLVERHRVTERQTIVRRVEPLLAELSAVVPAAVFEASVQRGGSLELEPVLRELAAGQ